MAERRRGETGGASRSRAFEFCAFEFRKPFLPAARRRRRRRARRAVFATSSRKSSDRDADPARDEDVFTYFSNVSLETFSNDDDGFSNDDDGSSTEAVPDVSETPRGSSRWSSAPRRTKTSRRRRRGDAAPSSFWRRAPRARRSRGSRGRVARTATRCGARRVRLSRRTRLLARRGARARSRRSRERRGS